MVDRIHGHKTTLDDLFVAARGVDAPEAQRVDDGTVGAFAGIPVVYDETMPVGVVELRVADRPVHRWLQQEDGTWVVLNVEALEAPIRMPVVEWRLEDDR